MLPDLSPGPVFAALVEPVLDPGSRTFWGSLAAAALVAVAVRAWGRREAPWTAASGGLRALLGHLSHRSTRLDLQLLLGRQLLRVVGLLPVLAGSWWLATHGVRLLDAVLGRPSLDLPGPVVAVAYTLTLFVAWDASRYLVHRLMHEVPSLWAFHQVHHSAEVLTPLTFHRVHPVESVLYAVRGWLVTTAVVIPFFWMSRGGIVEVTFLGVHAVGFALNTLTGNLRHSHLWWRFGPALERWWISPAQHQLHHSADAREQRVNYGTWLAVWDRLGGSLQTAPEAPPQRFGLQPHERNHGDDLVSAWLGPLRQAVRPVPTLAASTAVALALVPLPAHGQDATDDDADDDASEEAAPDDVPLPPDDPSDDDVIVVTDERGIPAVAGSAHVIDEEQLEQFEHDDIHRVLATVPGVYVRGEDGFGLRPNIGIRGASSERSSKVTLLEDGIPLAPAPYAAPAAYFFPNTTRLVGVEVFKGPSATQHGPYTIGGAINLRTRAVPEDGPAAGVDLAGGLWRSGKAHGWVGTGDDRGGVLLEAVHLGSGGFQHLPQGGPTGFQRTEVMAKGRLVLSDGPTHHHLDLKLGYAREVSHQTYMGLHDSDAAVDPWLRYRTTDEALMRWGRTQAQVGWTVRRDRLQIRTVAYRHDLRRAWTKLNQFADGTQLHPVVTGADAGENAVYLAILRGEEDSVLPGQQLLLGTNDRLFASTGVQSRARFEIGRGAVQARGEVGLRLHHDDTSRLHTEIAHDVLAGELVDTGEGVVTTLDRDLNATALAAHTHWAIDMGTVQLEPGLRLETVHTGVQDRGESPDKSQLRATPLPGLGVLVRAAPLLDVFGGVHRGFSPVGPGQPPETRPETAWNGELGTRWGRAERGLDATLFGSLYQNLSGVCTFSAGCDDDAIDRQFNAGEVLVAGVETAARDEIPLRPGLTLPVRAAYTFTHAAFQSRFSSAFPQFGNVQAGDRLPYLPTHTGQVTAGLAHERVHGHVGLEFRSGLYDAAAPPSTSPGIPPMALLDAALHVRVHGGLWVYGVGTNLANSAAAASLRPAGFRPVAPRQVMLGVRWRPEPSLP